MARNHIHMAPGIGKNNVISGMRGNCEVVIEVNMAKAMFGPDQLPFYVSSNQVILTPGLKDSGALPVRNFRSVFDIQQKKLTYEAPFDYILVYDFECQCTN